MDVDFNGDVASLDAEMLQLPDVSPLAIKANPHVAEKLFDQWLSLPDTVSLVIFGHFIWLLIAYECIIELERDRLQKLAIEFGEPNLCKGSTYFRLGIQVPMHRNGNYDRMIDTIVITHML